MPTIRHEMHPHAPLHPVKGAEILLARGVDPAIVHAILPTPTTRACPREPARSALYAVRRADRLRARVRARAAGPR